MSNLLKYYKSENSEITKNLVSNLDKVTISRGGYGFVVGNIFGKPSKEQVFKQQVIDLATSDQVLKELDDKLGTPKINETEDEFVQRGKDTLRKIIKNTLK